MKPLLGYLFLANGIIFGIASNSFAKISEGFTKLTPSVLCILFMCITMFSIAKAMSALPVGFAYSTYSGLTVTGSGDPFKIMDDDIYLPPGSDGSNISGEMKFLNTTISDLDLTLGSVSYQLGNNKMEIYTSPAPLPILGLPVVFSYFKKLKEKSRLRGGAKQAPIGASNSKL